MAVECPSCKRHILETDNRLPPWCQACGADLKGATAVAVAEPPRPAPAAFAPRPAPVAALESRVEGPPLRPDDADALGPPERVYRGSVVRQLLCWFGSLIGVAFLALIGYVTVHPPKTPVSDAAFYGLSALGLTGAVGGAYFALKFRGLSYAVYGDALVRRDGGETTIIRWEHVRQVFEKVHPAWISYRVVARGGDFELTGDVAGHRALGETIELRAMEHQLPAALRELDEGRAVSFGPLAVGKAALWHDGQQLPWSTVGLTVGLKPDRAHRSAMVSNMVHLHIFSNQPTAYLELDRVPNYKLFLALVGHVAPQCLPAGV